MWCTPDITTSFYLLLQKSWASKLFFELSSISVLVMVLPEYWKRLDKKILPVCPSGQNIWDFEKKLASGVRSLWLLTSKLATIWKLDILYRGNPWKQRNDPQKVGKKNTNRELQWQAYCRLIVCKYFGSSFFKKFHSYTPFFNSRQSYFTRH